MMKNVDIDPMRQIGPGVFFSGFGLPLTVSENAVKGCVGRIMASVGGCRPDRQIQRVWSQGKRACS